MSTPLERLRAYVQSIPANASDAENVALGLLVVAEAIHEHTEALREGWEGQGEGIADVSAALRDLQREVAFIGSRIARGA